MFLLIGQRKNITSECSGHKNASSYTEVQTTRTLHECVICTLHQCTLHYMRLTGHGIKNHRLDVFVQFENVLLDEIVECFYSLHLHFIKATKI